ncbi:hypothetical protein ACFVU2_02280 [Leifsonia sp. NPDC058194]|uniref:hypothetical protein n=1 Tax=Leifsonia sp. NPDC058194 TaxID=3346374 RepID=UPI0036DCD0B9
MTPFKNRSSRRLAAAIGTVAAFAVTVIPSGASVADNPAYPASLPTGYVSALPNSAWTIRFGIRDDLSSGDARPGCASLRFKSSL